MTYQAYQTCALSSSFILRTLNWTFDLPTRHKLTVQQSPSPTNLVVQQKELFILPHGIVYLTTHDWRWLKSYHLPPLKWESICGYRFSFWQHFIFNERMVLYPWPWYRATKQTWLLINQETPDKGKNISSYSTFKRCLLTNYDNYESVSSRNPKNCSNTHVTFSALELKAYPRYIFSGFELPPWHTNTIFVPSIWYIQIHLENELHHALTTTKR